MKRRIAVLIACLLVGAVANVLVAWGCAAWGSQRATAPWPRPQPLGDRRARLIVESVGATAVPFINGSAPAVGVGVQWTVIRIHDGLPPEAPARPPAFGGAAQARDYAVHVRTGWPALALEGGSAFPSLPTEPGPDRGYDAIVLPGTSCPVGVWGVRSPSRALPLRPMWPGFLLNLLLYVPAVWLVLRVPLALRRLARRLAWQCARCAYPVGASALCTECGAPVALHGHPATLFRSLAATLAIAPRRRAIARASGLIGALLAGAAINVAVAWSCAVWSDATASPVGIMAPRRGEVHRADCAWWRRHAPGDLSAVTPDGVTHLRMGLGKQWSGMWREPRWDLGPPQVFHHGGSGWRVRAGWPMFALEHDRWQEDNRIDLQIHGAVLLVPDFMWGASDSCVPLRPVFPGAIVNTLFYAVGLALIRAGARRLQGYRGAPAGTDPPLFTVAAHRS